MVAWDAGQRTALSELLEKSRANGYNSARILDADELRDREPFLGPGAQGALEVPDESIIDPWSPVLGIRAGGHGRRRRHRSGHRAALGSPVRAGRERVSTSRGEVSCRWLINAAGVSADLIDTVCGHGDFRVLPRRGELLVFDKSARQIVNSVILPVPSATTKGVVIAPTVFGNVLLGPTADDLDDRQATGTTEKRHRTPPRCRTATDAHARRTRDHRNLRGIRAATESRDFQIHLHPGEGYICVGGIRSTGLSASLAIAEHVADLLVADGCSGAGQRRNPHPRPCQHWVRAATPITGPGASPRASYGRILCHCEQVSAGELQDACGGPLGARNLGGLRRRTRAMNGRCQCFYCGATVLALLAEQSGLSVSELTGLEP